MTRRTTPSPRRLAVILERQDPVRWGAKYIPGQLGTKEEAPEASRPGTVYSHLLGREVHVMGNPERYALLLGFYSGLVGELHEGRMIHSEPASGPMTGYEPAKGIPMVGHSGTINVADRLGLLRWHPTIQVPDKADATKKLTVGYPLLGDLLWYLHLPGRIRCVNWTVKDKEEDFEKPYEGSWPPRRISASQVEAARARVLIEEATYLEAKVPTIRVALELIPVSLRENLRAIYKFLRYPCALDENLRRDFIGDINLRLSDCTSIFETARGYLSKYGGTLNEYQKAANQAIWNKEVRINLNQSFCFDQPVRPEPAKMLSKFAQWFDPPVT